MKYMCIIQQSVNYISLRSTVFLRTDEGAYFMALNISKETLTKFLLYSGERESEGHCATPLSESAKKTLGLLIAKSKQVGNFLFEAFNSLSNTYI